MNDGTCVGCKNQYVHPQHRPCSVCKRNGLLIDNYEYSDQFEEEKRDEP